MAWNFRKEDLKAADRESGVVAVEFVILFPVFLLVLLGIMEFGHLFYVRHTLTNASREGARAAVMFHSPASDRASWAQTQAATTVNYYLQKRLPGVTWTMPAPQVSGSSPGSTVTVQITATNASLILGNLVTAFQNLSVSAQTTMKME